MQVAGRGRKCALIAIDTRADPAGTADRRCRAVGPQTVGINEFPRILFFASQGDGVSARHAEVAAARHVGQAVELLITLLDQLHGDADLEDEEDACAARDEDSPFVRSHASIASADPDNAGDDARRSIRIWVLRHTIGQRVCGDGRSVLRRRWAVNEKRLELARWECGGGGRPGQEGVPASASSAAEICNRNSKSRVISSIALRLARAASNAPARSSSRARSHQP